MRGQALLTVISHRPPCSLGNGRNDLEDVERGMRRWQQEAKQAQRRGRRGERKAMSCSPLCITVAGCRATAVLEWISGGQIPAVLAPSTRAIPGLACLND